MICACNFVNFLSFSIVVKNFTKKEQFVRSRKHLYVCAINMNGRQKWTLFTSKRHSLFGFSYLIFREPKMGADHFLSLNFDEELWAEMEPIPKTPIFREPEFRLDQMGETGSGPNLSDNFSATCKLFSSTKVVIFTLFLSLTKEQICFVWNYSITWEKKCFFRCLMNRYKHLQLLPPLV